MKLLRFFLIILVPFTFCIAACNFTSSTEKEALIKQNAAPRVVSIAWGIINVQECDGSITVYDENSSKDCKLSPRGSQAWDWSLTKTHHNPGIQKADVQDLLDTADIFVLSRGMDLVLQVKQETVDFLKQAGKEVYVLQSEEAVAKYNELVDQGKRVAALIHSTC